MVKVSVIVPAYNASGYIKKCLDTLTKQTLKEIEIIIVNDGSTDDTEKIIKEYMKNHKQIKYFYKENGGQSSARNLGLTYAAGEYISFVDSDDYIEPTMIEKLYNEINSKKLDVVICGINYTYDDRIEKVYPFKKNQLITQKDFVITNPCPWNKIYRKSLLDKNKFKFPEGIIYEDLSQIPRVGIWTKKIGYVNECLYNYIIHDNSTMNISKYNPKINGIFTSLNLLYEHFEKKNKVEEFHDELEHIFIHHLLFNANLRFYSFKRYDEIKKISKIMKEKFPNWRKNKTYKEFSRKDKLILNLFYYNQIHILNFVTSIKKIFRK